MTREQLKRLLETYGADQTRWPDGDRAAATQYVADNPDARMLVEQYRSFDDALDRYDVTPNVDRMRANLLEGLPTKGRAGLLDRLLAWLLPDDPHYFWKPALAATLPLLIGLLVGSNVELSSDYAYDSWDEEIALLALDDQATNEGTVP